MTEPKSPIERVLDIAVYAPVGLAENAGEEFDRLVEKGRHRVEGQIQTARIVGQFVVQTARRQAQRVFESAVARVSAGPPDSDDGGRAVVAPAQQLDEQPPRTDSSADGSQPSGSPGGFNGSASGTDLAIPGYDSLSASQVVQRLEGLSREELEDVNRHEQAHRHRRTILNRVDQLLSGVEPEQPSSAPHETESEQP
jgi:hypothetical protein